MTKRFCHQCGFETERNDSDPIYKGECPYHQKVIQTEEGPVFAWDEMDQDGESRW